VAPDPAVIAAALAAVDPLRPVVAASPAVAAAFAAAGRAAEADPRWRDRPARSVAALVLAADELSAAGDHAEELVAAAGDVLRPGGTFVASALAEVVPALRGTEGEGGRRFRSDQLARALGHRGFVVGLLAAPGVGGLLAGGGGGAHDPVTDRLPGLLDAGTRVLAAGTAPPDGPGRSSVFFATLPRKVVAAATLTRAADGRVLVVHDTFRAHWTIPGGVVDADEDPRTGAERETWEETGLRVAAADLLGVFAAPWPDRLVLVYAAAPVEPGAPDPRPVHAHEVDGAAWVDLDEALRRVNPATRAQLRRCLDEPGGTWRE